MRGLILRAAVMTSLPLALVLAAAVPGSVTAGAATPAQFLVGAAAEDLTPPPAQMAKYIADKNFYLGGYGISSGTAQVGPVGVALPCPGGSVPCLTPRYATGVMNGPRVGVQAMVVSDGKRSIAFAELDTQGMFAAYQANPANLAARPYGIDDVRSAVAKATNGGLAFNDITISGDHSHAGQDLIGVWGFVPDDYLAFVKAQAVKALVDAFNSRQAATIHEGAVQTPGPCDPTRILNDQFDCKAAPNNVMDPELRVLQAVAIADGHVIGTVLNFAAHATVMGGGNTLLSPDWPGFVAEEMHVKYGGVGVTIVADVGRSQPNRGDCSSADKTSGKYLIDPREPDDSCRLAHYSSFVMSYVDQALASATPLATGKVDGRELFIHDPASNLGILALDYVGQLVGAPVARADLPPYSTANIIGTWVGVYRVGDVVITANPGEAYPNIRQQFMAAVPGARRYWTTGLSNDQLGYLVAPFPEAYPQVIQAGAGGNDNILFNVSETIGDHVMCTQAKAAVQMGLAGSTPSKCAVFDLEPNVYGPGGVDTGPAGAQTQPGGFAGDGTDAANRLLVQGLGAGSALPNTATGRSDLPPWALPATLLVLVLVGVARARRTD